MTHWAASHPDLMLTLARWKAATTEAESAAQFCSISEILNAHLSAAPAAPAVPTQTPLPADIAKIVGENLWGLYSRSGPEQAAPVQAVPEGDPCRAALQNLLWQVDRFCEQYGEADFETAEARAALSASQGGGAS